MEEQEPGTANSITQEEGIEKSEITTQEYKDSTDVTDVVETNPNSAMESSTQEEEESLNFTQPETQTEINEEMAEKESGDSPNSNTEITSQVESPITLEKSNKIKKNSKKEKKKKEKRRNHTESQSNYIW